MERDFSKLIGLIVEKFGTRKAFCDEIKKRPEWLSRRLNCQTEMSSDDIMEFVTVLGIEPRDIGVYFFTPKVR